MAEHKQVDTGGGAYVEGNVSTTGGNFVGRDSIGMQINNFFHPGLDPPRLVKARSILLDHVRKFWIEGVLNKSLYNEILLSLNMEDRPSAVENRPWDMILQTPKEPDRALPAGTKIIDIFDQCQQSLLLLGVPGAGKTTSLLELARDLLARSARSRSSDSRCFQLIVLGRKLSATGDMVGR